MKKHEKRYHVSINNKVASIYIDEVYLPESDRFQRFTDGTETIHTCYYEYIGICVGNSKRSNNDWWNGDKSGWKLYNKSTGTASTFKAIVDTLAIHVLEFYCTYGYYCCVFEPTDKRRRKTYMKAIKHICKKSNLDYRYVIKDDNEIMVYIW